MKAQRLLAITMLLLGKDSVAAPELARRFEVSVRTIYRDIDALCEAGIPVVAYPGGGGGYGILGDFKIDRSLLKPGELGQLSATLGSLSLAVGDSRMGQAADRLEALRLRSGRSTSRRSGGSGASSGRGAPPRPSLVAPENYVFVELAPAAREREKIAKLRLAIEEGRLASFSYVDGGGKPSERRVEPYALAFTWRAWFLYAFCLERGDFRLFKIARMKSARALPERFSRREVDLESRPWTREWDGDAAIGTARIRFADGARAEEHFAEGELEPDGEGGAIAAARLPAAPWVAAFLLGLGLDFEVLEPSELRALVAARAAALLRANGAGPSA